MKTACWASNNTLLEPVDLDQVLVLHNALLRFVTGKFTASEYVPFSMHSASSTM